MTRIIFALSLVVCITACNTNPPIKAPANNFTSFEISYSDGWATRFSFVIDTTKAFLASYKRDTLFYGVLPDSIFQVINKNAFNILHDSSITSKRIECYDCAAISILVTQQKDTVRLVQKGDIDDKVFFPIIETLQEYIESHRSSWKLLAYPELTFETMEPILPPPPPKIK